MRSVFEGCDDTCGWVAAVIAVLAWGSFGVPLKSNSELDVHPLIMQSYKTIVCFVTSWLVVLLGEEVRWSNWGIVSGLFWVPGAACGIYGIRNAGLATAIGTWSAIQVFTSFVFGIIIFEEGVKSRQRTFLAFVLMSIGLIGMSKYAEPPPAPPATTNSKDDEAKPIVRRAPSLGLDGVSERASLGISPTRNTNNGGSSRMQPLEMEPATIESNDSFDSDSAPLLDPDKPDVKSPRAKERLIVLIPGKLALTRRQLGICGAVVNGAWGGMNLVPLHYAQRDDNLTGAGYLISFAGGALIVNTVLWLLFLLYYLYRKNGQWWEAVECMPNPHLELMLWPGFMAGSLYSLGNFTAILAVAYLGQGVGFSFCQNQILVSGLWGVFYFNEIHRVAHWFASAGIAVLGIIWLSYEHEGSNLHR